MGSEVCLSVLLVMPSYAWRRGPHTPRTGGEWRWGACWGTGSDASHLLCVLWSAALSDPFPALTPRLSRIPDTCSLSWLPAQPPFSAHTHPVVCSEHL